MEGWNWAHKYIELPIKYGRGRSLLDYGQLQLLPVNKPWGFGQHIGAVSREDFEHNWSKSECFQVQLVRCSDLSGFFN